MGVRLVEGVGFLTEFSMMLPPAPYSRAAIVILYMERSGVPVRLQLDADPSHREEKPWPTVLMVISVTGITGMENN
jgi:hypothetical protein